MLSLAVGIICMQVISLKLSCFVAGCHIPFHPQIPGRFLPVKDLHSGDRRAFSSCCAAIGRPFLLSGRHAPKRRARVFMFVYAVDEDLSAIQNSVNTCWKQHSKSPYVPEEMPNKVMIALYVHSWLASIKADSWWGMPSYAFLLPCYSEAWLEPICFP